MSLWQRWVRQPRTLLLRRVLFQIHLWCGLLLGLYVVVLCATGSALVFRPQMTTWLDVKPPAYQPDGKALSRAELTAAAQRAYPDHEVTRVGESFSARRAAIEIWVERDGQRRQRLFNPYTGEDLGDALPAGVRAILWTARLHNDLLAGETGKRLNGIGSALLTLIALTGIVIWWPGIQSWRRALWVKWKSGWPRFNFDLHSALGFWFLGMVLLWGVSGVYLAIPEPFHDVIDAWWNPADYTVERPVDIFLQWFVRLHFGRWRGMPWLSALWVVMGLVPVIMFITGTAMWWNRKVKSRLTSRES